MLSSFVYKCVNSSGHFSEYYVIASVIMMLLSAKMLALCRQRRYFFVRYAEIFIKVSVEAGVELAITNPDTCAFEPKNTSSQAMSINGAQPTDLPDRNSLRPSRTRICAGFMVVHWSPLRPYGK